MSTLILFKSSAICPAFNGGTFELLGGRRTADVVFFTVGFFDEATLVAFFGVTLVCFLLGVFLFAIFFSPFFSLFWRKTRASPASATFIISDTTDRYF
jgi:hypothetical protein